MRPLATFLLALGWLAAAGLAVPAMAQTMTLDFGQGGGVTERALQLIALITVLSLAPSILIMVTSFTRIVVVLSLLRSALGTQDRPAQCGHHRLALFLTAFIMARPSAEAYTVAAVPLLANQITPQQAFERGVSPSGPSCSACAREGSRPVHRAVEGAGTGLSRARSAFSVVPAFMISELRRAFEIGFLPVVPFLIIDLVVASILMSVGMMMLPPVIIALPFKLIFFVLVDGWGLVAGSLVKSYGE